MLARLEEKRVECLDEIEICEEELRRAKIKLELLDEIIADAKAEEDTEEERTCNIEHPIGYIE